jgi:hypothetical protein
MGKVMSDCPQFGKLIGGCKFEARYDEPLAFSGLLAPGMFTKFEAKVNGENVSAEDLLPMRKYVRDVCVRCGKVVERS